MDLEEMNLLDEEIYLPNLRRYCKGMLLRRGWRVCLVFKHHVVAALILFGHGVTLALYSPVFL